MKLSDVKALTSQDINSLSVKELRQAAGIVRDVAAKRVGRMESRFPSLAPSAQKYVDRGQITTSTRGMTQEEARDHLREELNRGLKFLKGEGSTVKGWARMQENLANKLNEAGISASPDEAGRMLNDFQKALDEGMIVENYKYEFLAVLEEYQEQDEEVSLQEVADEVYERFEERELEDQQNIEAETGISSIID